MAISSAPLVLAPWTRMNLVNDNPRREAVNSVSMPSVRLVQLTEQGYTPFRTEATPA